VSAPLWTFNGGVHPPPHKSESNRETTRPARLPKRLILPLHQHIGEPAKAAVQVGDHVLKGQLIAHANGYVSAALHAPSSGRVSDIGDYPVPHPSGLSAPCIVIDTDGEERWIERPSTQDYTRIDPSHLRNMIREAGIVGLGGAGFPAFIKLNPGASKTIDTLILNGVECEPYITCDDRLMRERAGEILNGLRIMRHALHARECIIAIEDNKPEAYEIMREAAVGEAGVRVALLPTIYPQGSEKQLIKVVTGKEVPSNGLPLHIGIVMHNVGTAYAVYRALQHGEPLISRYVTVTGDAVKQPRNLEVLFGTSVLDLLDECGADLGDIDRIIMGGPMMGFALHTVNTPVVKTANCILATTTAATPRAQPAMPCIRCGACMDACPANLLPQQLYWYAHAKDFHRIQEYKLFDCIECGCCSYVCPSHIPLVQYYRFAKAEIWSQEHEKEKAELARKRHESRQQRLEREKNERASRLHKKKTDLKAPQAAEGGTAGESTEDKSEKKAAILAALERARAKREEEVKGEND
jgi:electron transport complex protein RnfC